MVGAAGIEPATTGLEIPRAYSLRRYPSVFSPSSFFVTVHSESFGDDLLRGIGQTSGRILATLGPGLSRSFLPKYGPVPVAIQAEDVVAVRSIGQSADDSIVQGFRSSDIRILLRSDKKDAASFPGGCSSGSRNRRAVTGAAQDNAELVFNATRRNIYCVAPDVGEVFDPPPKGSDPTKVLDVSGMTKDRPCGKLADYKGFLVQEKRSELRVFRRKFLTRYSLFVDSVTKIQSFRTQDLKTAANLTTPLSNAVTGVSKGAVPKGLATNGTLTLRNAKDLVTELLNPATASNPVSEIASDWVVVKREAENVLNDARSFRATWGTVVGTPTVANACLSGYAAANLISANECLDELNQAQVSGSFSRSLPTYSDEDAFRALFVKDNAAIAMVASLANQLALQTPSLRTSNKTS